MLFTFLTESQKHKSSKKKRLELGLRTYYNCVNKVPNFYDTLCNIIPTCIFDAFKAMSLTAPSFWDVTICYWVIQKSSGLEFRNLCILKFKALYFSPKRQLLIIVRRGVILRKKRLRKSSISWVYRSADKSLARPGRKQTTTTEDFDVHVSYVLS